MRFARLIHRIALACCIAAPAVAGDAVTEPAPNVPLSMARAVLPAGTPSRESEHFVLLTDSELTSADLVLEMLEAAHRSVQRSCRALGVQPKPLTHKIVAVLFRDHADYRRFNDRFKPDVPDWTVGYYDPMSDRLVMFDLLSQPDVLQALAKARRTGERFEREVAAANIPPSATGATVDRINQVRGQIDQGRQRIEADARNAFMSTIAHEATHGLLFSSGVQTRLAPYPFWVSEGLATNFEPTHARDFDLGFHRDNPERRRVFEQAARQDQLPRLSELVECDMAPAEDARGEVGRLYATSCIFAKWLARERPTELRLYLDMLRDGSWGDRETRMRKFEQVFGPVEALERTWLRAEAKNWQELLVTPAGRRLRDFDRTPAKVPEAASSTAGG